VWRLLRGRLGWSVQRTERQAKERDEEAIQHWVAHEWPRIKKGTRKLGMAGLLRRVGHLADPTGAAHLVAARHHADPAPPHGLEEGLDSGRARLLPDATKARLCFHLQQDSYDTDALIGVLEQLAGFYADRQVVLLWDGLSSHWSYKMRAHLDKQCAWLQVERLPAHAPELNSVEYLWANLKGIELANFTGDTVAEVADQAQGGIQRVCDCDSLVLGFLAHTGLSLDDEPSPKVKVSISRLQQSRCSEIRKVT
jgi:DDE superfamily endonuclease/Winged helix-turn helix